MTAPAQEFAPAKVNLALHVTGRRADGYHLLDSLVAFPRVGDSLAAAPAEEWSLAIDGPFAAGLEAGPDNFVLRAAALFPPGPALALRLAKQLPVASGIGGGSADAAAALRLIARLRAAALPAPAAVLGLGADVPVCLAGQPARMSGIGEVLVPLRLPPAWLVLVNPGVPVPTGAVFARLASRDNPPLGPLPAFADAPALAGYLAAQRNDLEPPARAVAPVVGEVIAALGQAPGCRIVRMSGSGATCFGLFATEAPAEAAAADIRRRAPGWWVAAAPLG